MADNEELLVLITEVRGDVKTLLRDVVGNGSPGLLRRVASLEEAHNRGVGAQELVKAVFPLTYTLVAAIIGAISGFLTAHIHIN